MVPHPAMFVKHGIKYLCKKWHHKIFEKLTIPKAKMERDKLQVYSMSLYEYNY